MERRKYSSRQLLGALVLAAAATAAAGECPAGVQSAAAAVAALHGAGSLPVRCETVAADELAARLRERLEASTGVPLATELEVAWRLGLTGGRRPAEIEEPLLRLLASQVLGYYDPARDTMVLVEGGGGALPGMDQLVWFHEAEHAYQEHRYGLGSRLLALRGNTDAQLAASAVAEGDAVLVMAALAIAEERPTPEELADGAEAILDALGAAGGSLGGGDVPAAFVEQVLFPYREGTRFVAAALRAGGWSAVGRLLESPPASTEQILHPERRNDAPETIADGDLPVVPGYDTVVVDTSGEWALGTWLGLALPREEALRAAEGWDGDRYRLARSTERPELWRLDLLSRWDTPGDAEEAAAAFEAALPRLLVLGPGPAAVTVRVEGRSVTVTAAGTAPDAPAAGRSAVPSSPAGPSDAPRGR